MRLLCTLRNSGVFVTVFLRYVKGWQRQRSPSPVSPKRQIYAAQSGADLWRIYKVYIYFKQIIEHSGRCWTASSYAPAGSGLKPTTDSIRMKTNRPHPALPWGSGTDSLRQKRHMRLWLRTCTLFVTIFSYIRRNARVKPATSSPRLRRPQLRPEALVNQSSEAVWEKLSGMIPACCHCDAYSFEQWGDLTRKDNDTAKWYSFYQNTILGKVATLMFNI